MTHLLLEGHLLCIIKATEQRQELLPLVPELLGRSDLDCAVSPMRYIAH